MSCETKVNNNHFKFEWVIHNFNFALFNEIRSPCFRIPLLNGTSWCISIRRYDLSKKDEVSVYIHRMEGEFETCNLKVRAKMTFHCYSIHDRIRALDVDIYNSENGILVFSMTEPKLFYTMPLNTPFVIQCTLSVSHSSDDYEDDLLSDISSLFPSGDNADLILDLGTESFSIHKAILFARLPSLCSALGIDWRHDSSDTVAHVDDVPYHVMQCLLNYAYGKPYKRIETDLTTALHEACDTYYVDELHRQMHTWISHSVTRTTMQTERRLVLLEYDNMISGNRESKLEIRSLDLEVMRSPHFYILFRMLGHNDEPEYLKLYFSFPIFRSRAIFMACTLNLIDCQCPISKMRLFCHTFESSDEWSPDFQIQKRDLLHWNKRKNAGLVRGIKFDILLSEGDHISSSENSQVQNGTDLLEESDYERMSVDLDFLLKDRDHAFSDITLVDRDGGKHFAHHAILAARSDVFRNMLRSVPEEEKNSVSYPIPADLLNSILRKIYTGQPKDLGVDEYITRNTELLSSDQDLGGPAELVTLQTEDIESETEDEAAVNTQ